MTVVRDRPQRAGRGDVQHAAVLHVQPVVVVGVECAGHLQSALDEPVACCLGQLGLAGDAGDAIAIHAAVQPVEVVAERQVAAAEQVGTRHREVAAAGDHRVTGQSEAAAGQGQRTCAACRENGRNLVADVVVGIQTDLPPGGDIDLCPGVRAEHGGTTAATVEVDVAVVRCRLKRAGRREVQRAAVADVELKVVLQVERARNVESAVEVAVVEIRRQFAGAGQRDRAGARHHAAVPDQPAERQRCTAVERAGEVERAGDRCGGAVDVERAVVQRIVAVDRHAGIALQPLRADM